MRNLALKAASLISSDSGSVPPMSMSSVGTLVGSFV